MSHYRSSVLTGDLVKSSRLTPAQITQAFDALGHCAEVAATWHGAPLKFTRHRGDGWQVLLHRPRYALRTALFFRATIKSLGPEFDSYIGIATGEAAMTMTADLNDRNEAVFVQSGHALEDIKTKTGKALATLKSMNSFAPKLAYATPGAEAAAVALADHIAEDWTPNQAEAMAHMLSPIQDMSYTDLAKTLDKSRQVVTKTLLSAGYQSLYLALHLLENQDD
ncbi:hypothetical protein N6L24_03725 [Cognatishimia sp. SS12]|uniref:hypothetical protein n=1 Tax=Cognatishimia sp. SS12 TaxID=2979465 RepID=UPI0023312F34|nr:hypothetical protein [Cognatishimia sp. SS12]MDC0737374.1 hypothetical protein [Cognatishimia sp. SS12]